MNEETRNEIVNSLFKTISKTGIQNNTQELIEVLAHLLFSIGSSLEDVNVDLSSVDVLMRYGNNPTVGNVLMAQALHMKETWTEKERSNNGKQEHTGTGIIQGKTEEE